MASDIACGVDFNNHVDHLKYAPVLVTYAVPKQLFRGIKLFLIGGIRNASAVCNEVVSRIKLTGFSYGNNFDRQL